MELRVPVPGGYLWADDSGGTAAGLALADPGRVRGMLLLAPGIPDYPWPGGWCPRLARITCSRCASRS